VAVLILYDMLRETISSGGFAAMRKKTVRLIITLIILPAIVFGFLNFPAAYALLYGDVNDDGAVNIQDVVLAMQHTLDLDKLADKQKLYADVNNDGIINILDVSLIMQKTLGLVEGFPDLPQSEADLVKDFIVADGVAPGKKLVVVTLTVSDPQSYRVYIAGETLVYSDAVAGFSGEIGEENALQSKVAVLKR
jgi:hypothetical protein